MGSKFARRPRVQPPPKICHSPPPGPEWPPLQIQRTYWANIAWPSPGFPLDEFTFTGTIPLDYSSQDDAWIGHWDNGDFQINLNFAYRPELPNWSLALAGGNYLGEFTNAHTDPEYWATRPALNTGLRYAYPKPWTSQVRFSLFG